MTSSASPRSSPSLDQEARSARPSPSADETEEVLAVRGPTLRALFDRPRLDRELGQPSLQVLDEIGSGDGVTRYRIEYQVDGATVSGTLTRPDGEGPFPAVVTNHGLIPPDVYTVGQGLAREEEALARAGYVSLHSDYRGYGASDPLQPLDRELRLAYTRDVIQAVRAVRTVPYVDGRVAMVGRSMGGGLALNVLVSQPDLVDAAVLLSPVSSDIVDNLERLASPEVLAQLYARHGDPAQSPGFYRDLSAAQVVDRVAVPVAIQHGDADAICPLAWSKETLRLLTSAGVDATLSVYPGEGHVFEARWQESMQETLRFLRATVPPR